VCNQPIAVAALEAIDVPQVHHSLEDAAAFPSPLPGLAVALGMGFVAAQLDEYVGDDMPTHGPSQRAPLKKLEEVLDWAHDGGAPWRWRAMVVYRVWVIATTDEVNIASVDSAAIAHKAVADLLLIDQPSGRRDLIRLTQARGYLVEKSYLAFPREPVRGDLNAPKNLAGAMDPSRPLAGSLQGALDPVKRMN
jgi:hypothetical protein